MQTNLRYENFPVWIVAVSNISTILLYVSAFFIVYEADIYSAIIYMFFVLTLELRLIKNHCVNCYYFGKVCGFGKGKISALFFKKGDDSKFCNMQIKWKDMIPDMLVSLIPIITGIVLLIIKFTTVILVLLAIVLIITTIGNAFVRGSLTCKHCKQQELGCPADKLFNK